MNVKNILHFILLQLLHLLEESSVCVCCSDANQRCCLFSFKSKWWCKLCAIIEEVAFIAFFLIIVYHLLLLEVQINNNDCKHTICTNNWNWQDYDHWIVDELNNVIECFYLFKKVLKYEVKN